MPLVYKHIYFIKRGSEKLSNANRLCIFKAENNLYISEWFWDAEIVDDFLGCGRQEFPYYKSDTEKIYVIKNNKQTIVDRIMSLE